jgi:cell division protease FtsH
MPETEHDPNRPSNRPQPGKPNRGPRSLMLWALIIATVVFLFVVSGGSFDGAKPVDYQTFMEDVRANRLEEIVVHADNWEGALRTPPAGETYPHGAEVKAIKFETAAAPDSEMFKELLAAVNEQNKQIAAYNEAAREFNDENPTAPQKELKHQIELYDKTLEGQIWNTLLTILLPALLVIVLLYFFFFRQFRAAGGQSLLNFGRSRARMIRGEQTKVTFKDVAGIDEACEEVQEIVEFLKNPDRFRRLGGRLPRGVLLVGPPGSGKTLLAKAIAGESDVPFFSISGSDFVEMFVGVGASRVRDLFMQAKTNSPCIIFLDEIDAVGRRRGWGLGGGHDEREQTLNAILVEMDGFETDVAVIVIAATNRPDVLDPALRRPGRFDRTIVVDLPDIKGREGILRVHSERIRLKNPDDLKIIARGTPMFSGADLENLINEAAILASMRDHESVELADLEEARDRVLFGRERRSRVVDESERTIIAYHEAGHAITAHLLPDSEPLHKVGIIPRGMMGGATLQLPEKDRLLLSKKRAMATIAVLVAGRVAEKIFCNDISSGAASDLRQATDLARQMICQWGMSDELGPMVYSEVQEHLFLGREVERRQSVSATSAEKIDTEIRRIIEDGMATARETLSQHADQVKAVVDELLQREVLTADEVDEILRTGRLERPEEETTEEESGPQPVAPEPTLARETEVSPADDPEEDAEDADDTSPAPAPA